MSRTATFSITADANTAKIKACELGRQLGNYVRPEILDPSTKLPYKEADSEEFKAGDMVNLVTGSGTATSTVSKVLTGDNEPIAGFALDSANNTTTANQTIRIMPVDSINEYLMNVASSTAANTDLVSVSGLIGQCFDLAQATVTNTDTSTTYCTVVNLDAVTDARVVITGIYEDPTTTSATQYLRVFVKFLPFVMVSGDPTYQGLQFP